MLMQEALSSSPTQKWELCLKNFLLSAMVSEIGLGGLSVRLPGAEQHAMNNDGPRATNNNAAIQAVKTFSIRTLSACVLSFSFVLLANKKGQPPRLKGN